MKHLHIDCNLKGLQKWTELINPTLDRLYCLLQVWCLKVHLHTFLMIYCLLVLPETLTFLFS